MTSIHDRFLAKITKSDTCWLWTAAKDDDGYGFFKIADVQYRAHRVAYALYVGAIPDGLEVDHRCHTTSCVNPGHLRLATGKQNRENLRGARTNSASGVRGVSWHKAAKRWQAQVKHNGKAIHLGYFDRVADAAEAARQKRLELFTHNEIDMVAV